MRARNQDRKKMKRATSVSIAIVFAGAAPGNLRAGSATLYHSYFSHPEDPSRTGANPGLSAVAADGTVYPYSTVVLNFGTILTPAERLAFENDFRIVRNPDRVPEVLPHLHEALAQVDAWERVVPPAGMSAVGPHASFHWTTVDGTPNGRTQLRYRPHGMDGGVSYAIRMPAGWSISNGSGRFATRAFAGDRVRILEVVVPTLDGWRIAANPGSDPSQESVPAYVFDRFSGAARSWYFDARIKIRGFTSLQQPQKRYTLIFDRDHLFQGFKDESGEYQGPRRRIALIAGLSSSGFYRTLLQNKIGFDVYRALEKRRYQGATLSPDSYLSHLVLNGHYWGIYLAAEDISANRGGTTTMRDRSRPPLSLRRDAIVHKGDSGLRMQGLPTMEPRTQFEVVLALGDGRRTTYENLVSPFPIYGRVDPRDREIELEIEADDAQNIEMTLCPNMATARIVQNGIYGATAQYLSVDLMVQGTNPPVFAGSVTELNGPNPKIQAVFPRPVGNREAIELDFISPEDYLQMARAVGERQEIVKSWFDEESTLRHIFFVKWARAGDNINRNLYYLMNSDNLADLVIPGASPAVPRSPYRTIIWDCDFCMMGGFEYLNMSGAPLHWRVLQGEGPEKRVHAKRYVQTFIEELRAGGVLTVGFYEALLDRFRAQLGNDHELQAARWQNPFDPAMYERFLANVIIPCLTNSTWLREYVMSLNIGSPVEPDFIRGDADLSGSLEVTDGIAVMKYLFNNPEGYVHFCFLPNACDANDDGKVDMTDGIYILNFIFRGGPPPAAPFPLPGEDTTPSAIDW